MTSPRWVKAPGVLLRFPGLAAAVTLGAFLLVMAAATYPIFLSATASSAVEKEIRRVDRYLAGLSVEDRALDFDEKRRNQALPLFVERDRTFVRTLAPADGFGPPVITRIGDPIVATDDPASGKHREVRLASRTDAMDHVRLVQGSNDGALLADVVAASLNISPGDDVVLSGAPGRTAIRLRVAGTYRELFNATPTPYWMPLRDYIYPEENQAPPPAFLLVGSDRFLDLSEDLGQRRALFRWEAPVRISDGVTLSDARQLATFASDLSEDLNDPRSDFGRAFSCYGCQFLPGFRASSALPGVVSQVEERMATVAGPVQVVFAAGMAVALATIAAAGAFSVVTRKTESDLMFARGEAWPAMGLKTSLEACIPALAGGALGLAGAFVLVRVSRPGTPVEASAIGAAIRSAAFGVPAALSVLGLSAGASFLRLSAASVSRPIGLPRVPWEIAGLIGGAALLRELVSGSAFTTTSGVSRPSLALLLFPMVFVATASGLAARGLGAGLRALRDRSARMRPSAYLLIHRLAGAPGIVVGLFVAAALCAGAFAHGETIQSSLRATVDAKAKLFVGSDVQATVAAGHQLPKRFPFPSTSAIRIVHAGRLSETGADVDLLGIDPGTIAGAAYWEPEFGAPSLGQLARVVEPARSERLPAIAVGDIPDQSTLVIDDEDVPLQVAERVDAFPGMSSQRPLAIVDARALIALTDRVGASVLYNTRATNEIWLRGDPDDVLAKLATLEDPPYSALTAEEVKDIPSITAVVDTFGILNILGLGAGILVVVLIFLYLQARQRSQLLTYGLSKRMGLSERSHALALILELAALLLASYVTGFVLGSAATVVLIRTIDPLSTIPPGPLFEISGRSGLIAALVLACAAVIGGIVTNRAAGRSSLGDLMRLAD